jgi:hypothetical protein
MIWRMERTASCWRQRSLTHAHWRADKYEEQPRSAATHSQSCVNGFSERKQLPLGTNESMAQKCFPGIVPVRSLSYRTIADRLRLAKEPGRVPWARGIWGQKTGDRDERRARGGGRQS